MKQTENFKLNLVEGNDYVNPLVQDVPNYEKIDEVMHLNLLNSIGSATEVKEGTTHVITRDDTSNNIFRFQATSDYLENDSFTVDGNIVTAYLPNRNPLPLSAFKTNSELLCILNQNALTIFTQQDDQIINNAINNVEEQVTVLEKKKANRDKKIVIIGDSYGTGTGTGVESTPYTTTLKSILGMDDSNYFTKSKNGAGFINGEFLVNLQSLSIPNKDEIDEIYVFGGWNDGTDRGSTTNLVNGMLGFSNYVKANFKNAKLYLGFLAYGNTSDTVLARLRQSYNYYKNCALYGFDGFAQNSESICANRGASYWGSGSEVKERHPTTLMQNRIANFLAQFIQTKTLSIYDSVDCVFTGASSTISFDYNNLLKQTIVDNMVTTTLRGQTIVTFSSNQRFPRSTYTPIANVSGNPIVGASGEIRGLVYVDYQNASGDWARIPMLWRLKNNVFSLFNGNVDMTAQKIYMNGDSCTCSVINN